MRLLIACAFVILGHMVAAQTLVFDFVGTITNQDDAKKEGGVNVAVVQGGKTILTATTASNGRYQLKGDINYTQPFDIVYSKPGLVSKKVTFNLNGLNPEDLPAASEFKPVKSLDLDMFGVRPGVDFSFLDSEPVAPFNWDAKRGAAWPDYTAAGKVKAKIDKLLADAEKKAGENEAKYNAAITAADKLATEEKYAEAIKKYEEALTYKPTESYPAQRINDLDALLQKQKELALQDKQQNEEYYNLIKAGDNFRDAKEYAKAKAKYQEALQKKNEQYPKDEIAKIDKIVEQLEKEKANEAAYKELISLADMMFNQKSYTSALKKYEEASKLKPSEQYPKDRIAACNSKVGEQKAAEEKKKQYDQLIADGDKLFTEEKYEESKVKFQEALKIESASTYAKGKLTLIEEKLKAMQAEKAKLEQIQKLLGEGKTLFDAAKLDESKLKYDEVLKLDSENQTAKDQLAAIEKKKQDLADAAKKEADFAAAVKEGDAAVVAKKYDVAIAAFEKALAIKTDAQVQQKLTDAKKSQSDALNAAQKQQEFDELMKDGQTALTNKDLTTAKTKFESAALLFPDNANAKAKVKEVNDLIAKENATAALNAQIAEKLKEADALLADKKFAEAKTAYNAVLALDKLNESAKNGVKNADAGIAADADAAKKKADREALVKAADAAVTVKDFQTAITKYEQALALESTADVQGKLQQAKEAKAKQEEEAQKAQAEAEKAKQVQALLTEAKTSADAKKWELAKEKYQAVLQIDNTNAQALAGLEKANTELAAMATAAEKEQKVKTLLSAADSDILDGKFIEAKQKLNEVLTLDPANSVAPKKLAEVAKKEADAAADKAKAEAEAKLNKEFQELVTAGDAAMASNDLDNAIAKYEQALKVKADTGVEQKLNQAKKTKADLAAANAEQKAKLEKVNKLLSEGQTLQNQNKLDEALRKYEEVITLDANNAVAKSQIEAIQKKKNELASEAQLTQQFNDLKSAGLAAFSAKKYDEAEQKLQAAKAIKADPEIDAKLADIARIKQEQANAANADQQFGKLVSEGDQAANSSNWAVAVNKYTEALKIRQDGGVATKLAQAQKELAENASQAQLQAEFDKLIAEGDELVAAKNYAAAIQKYNSAGAKIPTSPIPAQRAAAAQALADKQSNDEADQAYEKILTVAEKKIQERDFGRARELLVRAADGRPSDPRPRNMLAELDLLEKNLKAFDALINEGDELVTAKSFDEGIAKFEQAKILFPTNPIPEQKIANARQMRDALLDSKRQEELYKNYMKQGGALAGNEQYQEALQEFENALSVKKGDAAATQKAEEMRKKIKELSQQANSAAELKAKYDKLIREADGLFNTNYYLDAKPIYESALKLIPDDLYAKNQIDACVKKAKEQSKLEADKEYNKIIVVADGAFNQSNYDRAIEMYKRALTIRSYDPYPKEQLKKIDLILNPPVEEGIVLEDLGEKFDGSIMDGAALLEKAEAERKTLKGFRTRRKMEKLAMKEEEKTANKANQQATTTNQIYDILKTVTINDKDNEQNRLSTIDQLKIDNEARTAKNTEIGASDYGLNIDEQDRLNKLGEQVNADVQIRQGVNIENAKVVSGINEQTSTDLNTKDANYYVQNQASDAELAVMKRKIAEGDYEDWTRVEEDAKKLAEMQDEISIMDGSIATDNYANNIASKGEITYIEQTIIENTKVSTEKQVENHEKVEYMSNKSQDIYGAGSNKQVTTAYSNENKVVSINQTVANIDNSQAQSAPKNKEVIQGLENTVLNDRGKRYDDNEIKYVENRELVTDVAIKVATDDVNRDKNRVETVDVVKEQQVKIADQQVKSATQFKDRSIDNKEQINQVNIENQVVYDNDARQTETNVKGVKQVQTWSYNDQVDKDLSDEDQRQAERRKVENANQIVAKNAATATNNQERSNESVKDLNKMVVVKQGEDAQATREKQLSSQEKLNDMKEYVPEKTVVANALGEEYPEGVSQEMFQKKDKDGLMTHIITRRIVVKNGHGTVYVKTQSMSAITYTKNGTPTTEHIWNSETNDATLQKHY